MGGAPRGCLINEDFGGARLKSPLVQQMRIYERDTMRAGLSHMHGLRHAYAQNRYEELTGWKCPAADGPAKASLTVEQRATDRDTRLTISSVHLYSKLIHLRKGFAFRCDPPRRC